MSIFSWFVGCVRICVDSSDVPNCCLVTCCLPYPVTSHLFSHLTNHSREHHNTQSLTRQCFSYTDTYEARRDVATSSFPANKVVVRMTYPTQFVSDLHVRVFCTFVNNSNTVDGADLSDIDACLRCHQQHAASMQQWSPFW